MEIKFFMPPESYFSLYNIEGKGGVDFSAQRIKKSELKSWRRNEGMEFRD